MSYELKSAGALSGEPCRYGQSRLLVRGPQRSLEDPYVAFLGGTEVYGRFVEFPFVDSLQTQLGLDCINLGSVNAGLDSFVQDDSLIGIARQADVSVVQMLGAQNISNPYYRVHPRRNDRFLQAHAALKTLYPEVDFTEFHFNKHLLCTLREISSQRFEQVQEQLQRSWIERMSVLIEALDGRVLLLWLRYELDAEAGFPEEPVLVDRSMADALRPKVQGVLEFRASSAAMAQDIAGMIFGQMELPAARHMIGPKEHLRIADALADRLLPLVRK
ncbi:MULTISPECIES: DUF6473 family protein [unclassified Leisingera]|uniref:DUF6473 family protein n=1 Tax=unclassified Leisingera TaxID=2614906 RepID=UPI0010105498|nr:MULTISPECIES: DUF6473 family protein [unclassified Leisingera]MBQ4827128.1 hypothetical protein [Leisingera sp. HS039]QAX28084.1 hypothetical protein ETW24_00870 [Leisingera sp. NJS204]